MGLSGQPHCLPSGWLRELRLCAGAALARGDRGGLRLLWVGGSRDAGIDGSQGGGGPWGLGVGGMGDGRYALNQSEPKGDGWRLMLGEH